MGMWGTAPWENDASLGWFERTLKPEALAAAVRGALAEDDTERVRAAAHLILVLCRGHLWSSTDAAALAEVASRRLEEALDPRTTLGLEYRSWAGDDTECDDAIRLQIAELREVLSR